MNYRIISSPSIELHRVKHYRFIHNPAGCIHWTPPRRQTCLEAREHRNKHDTPPDLSHTAKTALLEGSIGKPQFSSVLLGLHSIQLTLADLLKHITGPHPRVSSSSGLGWRPENLHFWQCPSWPWAAGYLSSLNFYHLWTCSFIIVPNL